MRLPWTASGGQWRARVAAAAGAGPRQGSPRRRGRAAIGSWIAARVLLPLPAAAGRCTGTQAAGMARCSSDRLQPRCTSSRCTCIHGTHRGPLQASSAHHPAARAASARAPALLHDNPRHSLARCWMVDSGRRATQRKGVMDSCGWLEGCLKPLLLSRSHSRCRGCWASNAMCMPPPPPPPGWTGDRSGCQMRASSTSRVDGLPLYAC